MCIQFILFFKTWQKCTINWDTVSDVYFETETDGGCETCSYEFAAASFFAKCSCANKVSEWYVSLSSTTLQSILTEMLQLERDIAQWYGTCFGCKNNVGSIPAIPTIRIK